MTSTVAFIYSIIETNTANEYTCVSSANKARQSIKMPFTRRSAAFDMTGADGGFNPRGTAADAASMRAVQVDLLVEYETTNGRDNFSKCIAEFEKKVAHGRECKILFVDSNGTTVRAGYGHCVNYDKSLTQDQMTFCRIPFTMLMPNPVLRSEVKTGTLVADNGLLADSGLFSDTDPDTFALTGVNVTHNITNNGSYPDRAPIIKLTGGTGGVTGPIGVTNLAIPAIGGVNYTFVYNGNIAAGEVVTFDTGAFDVYSSNNAIDSYLLFSTYSPTIPDGEWFRIDPGLNPIFIEYAAAGSGSYANIDWRDSSL